MDDSLGSCGSFLRCVRVPRETQDVPEPPVAAEVRVDIRAALDRCIYRVPKHMRENRKRKMHEYDPVVLSLGPYHHGESDYSRMEEFKKWVLDEFIKDAAIDRDFFYNGILERINEVRANYEKVDKNNEEFTGIILCDACFLLCYIDSASDTDSDLDSDSHPNRISFNTSAEIYERLGWSTLEFVKRDIWLLENQIPFWVIKHLFYLRFAENKANEFVFDHYLRRFGLLKKRITSFPWADDADNQPLHLLEARRTTLLTPDTLDESTGIVSFKCIKNGIKSCWTSIRNCFPINRLVELSSKCIETWKSCSKSEPHHEDTRWIGVSRSVTSLQSKGISFRPSSECLEDIKFISYYFYGVLSLPILLVGTSTNVFFQNDIAFELSPEDKTDVVMLAYLNFMKSLIETAKDVKELRQRGIIYTSLETDEEVAKVFKELEILFRGTSANAFFENVRTKVDKHCKSKAKTWIAELYHIYCRSPWAAIAIFAATAVLVLTFLQTYYTIH